MENFEILLVKRFSVTTSLYNGIRLSVTVNVISTNSYLRVWTCDGNGEWRIDGQTLISDTGSWPGIHLFLFVDIFSTFFTMWCVRQVYIGCDRRYPICYAVCFVRNHSYEIEIERAQFINKNVYLPRVYSRK